MSLRGFCYVDTSHGARVRAGAARARSLRPRARGRHVRYRQLFYDWGCHDVSQCGSANLRLVGRYRSGRLGDAYKVLCLWGSWALALLFALLLVPAVSLADTSGSGGGYFGWSDMIVDGNTVITEDGYQLQGYVVAASSRYDAACAVLGVDAGSLSSEAETKLSNESTGGQFYAFVQDMEVNEFGNYPAGWAGDTPFLSGLNSVYGVGNVYWIVTGDEAKDGARNDFNTVKNGGSLGGNSGGGGGDLSTIILLSGEGKVYRNSNVVDAGTLTVELSQTIVDRLESYSDLSNLYVFVINGMRDSRYNESRLYIIKTNQTVTYTKESSGYNNYYDSSAGTNVRTGLYNYVINVPSGSMVYSEYIKNTGWTEAFTSIEVNSLSFSASNNAKTFTYGGTAIFTNAITSGGGGETNNWPQPTQPNTDPPEVPSPSTPSEPTQPSVDPSDDLVWGTPPQFDPSDTLTPIVSEPSVTIVNVTSEPTGTDPTDYTPWLRAILNELKNIHTDLGNLLNGVISAINRVISALNDLNAALTTHCGHIRTAIHNDFNYYVRNIISQMVSDTNTVGTNIRTQVGWLVQSMRDCYSHLEDYLYDLFHWLAEQFDFTFPSVPSYDDRSVLYWLKKIWLRLGTNQYYSPIGPSSPTPTAQDVETGFDWWAWLLSLIDQLFNNVASELVEDVDAFVESLREIWPISVPWDLLGAFVLLGANPETPTWTVTIPSVCGLPSYDYVIDLHPYDGLAATVRNMETIVFAYYLLMKSDWLLDLISKGLQKCTVFFDSLVGT